MGYLMWFTLLLYFKYSKCNDPDYDDDYHNSGDDERTIELYWQDDDILILQTLDGKIHAVDKRSGGLLWETELNRDWFPQTHDESNCNNSGDTVDLSFLPDPSDGSIYAYNKGELSKLPLTIPQMVNISPSRSSDDNVVYIGEKKDNWYILDKQTGEIKSKINNKTKGSAPPSGNPIFAFDDIYIGYTDYTLTMYDAKSNDLKWNFTYSELRATESVSDLDPKHLDIEVSASSGDIWISGGEIEEARPTKKRLNLGFPVIGVFSSSKSGLRRHQFKTYPADHFSGRRSEHTVQLVYVGLHRQSLYAVQSYSDSNKKIAPGCGDDPCPEMPYDIIGWHDVQPGSPSNGRPGLPPGDFEIHEDHSPGSCRIGDSADKCPTHVITEGARPESDTQGKMVQDKNKYTNKPINIHINTTNNPVAHALYIAQIIEAMVNVVTNVKFLQSVIVVMMVLFVILHSWRNIFEEDFKKTKIGQIEFDQEELLGKGCLGTSVFRGSFDGRDVAVKRMLADSFALAEREIRLLRQAEHPNLLRYYCSEKDKMFIYIALELCHCDLDSFVSQRENFELQDREIMLQCATGLEHIHSLGVIHRDIKPSNILITFPRRNQKPRCVIADFGLSRQMEIGKSSISVTGLYGTEGWAAPEVFSRDIRSVTCAVDIFSLGCVYYFCLSGGKHPYGSEFFLRQARIYQGRFELENIDPILYELISRMIQPNSVDRITIEGVLKHPTFWEKDKILGFLSETSDRLEREEADSEILNSIEQYKEEVGGEDWKLRLAETLQKDLRKFRTYSDSIRDLLRAIRNKRHHHRDLTPEAQIELGIGPDSFWDYFDVRYPLLLSTIYKILSILYSEERDVNFDKFYDFKSAQIISRMVKLELEAIKLANEKAKDSVVQNFKSGTNGSVSYSPKVQRASQLNSDMPYSHKIKTKMIWAPKEKKEIRKPVVIPERTEPSICRLFDGTEIQIAKYVPLRDEPVSFEVMKNVQFPGILAIIQEMKNENQRIRNEKRLKSESFEKMVRMNNENNAYEETQSFIDVNHTPKLVKGLPTIFPRQKGSFLRAVQSVTNVIQRQFSENGSVGREICETLLKEELDADAETIQFSRDPTPPPFVIPEHKIDETSFKSCDTEITSTSSVDPSIDGSTDSADSPKLNDENQKPQTQNKKPCRRKRTKGNPKKKST